MKKSFNKQAKSLILAGLAASTVLSASSAQAEWNEINISDSITSDADSIPAGLQPYASVKDDEVTYNFPKNKIINIKGDPNYDSDGSGSPLVINAKKIVFKDSVGLRVPSGEDVTINGDVQVMAYQDSNYPFANGVAFTSPANGSGEKSTIVINGDLQIRKPNFASDWGSLASSRITRHIMAGDTSALNTVTGRWLPTGIYVRGTHGSSITVNGKMDIKVKGTGLETDPFYKSDEVANDYDLAILNVQGGKLITPGKEDNKENLPYYAIANYGGTINVNVKKDKGIITPLNQDLEVFGNIIDIKDAGKGGEYFYRSGQTNMGLTTADSKWEGTVDNAGTDMAGEINLFLSNGGQWINRNVSALDGMDVDNMPEPSNDHYGHYDGKTYIHSVTGGENKTKAGVVTMDNEAPLIIDEYQGAVKFIYDHKNAGTNKADYTSGDLLIGKAKENSHITLATDNNNIDTSKDENVVKTLSALATKVTYQEAKEGKANLQGDLEIMEGLTASAASVAVKDLQFNKSTGVGELKATSAPIVKPPVVDPEHKEDKKDDEVKPVEKDPGVKPPTPSTEPSKDQGETKPGTTEETKPVAPTTPEETAPKGEMKEIKLSADNISARENKILTREGIQQKNLTDYKFSQPTTLIYGKNGNAIDAPRSKTININAEDELTIKISPDKKGWNPKIMNATGDINIAAKKLNLEAEYKVNRKLIGFSGAKNSNNTVNFNSDVKIKLVNNEKEMGNFVGIDVQDTKFNFNGGLDFSVDGKVNTKGIVMKSSDGRMNINVQRQEDEKHNITITAGDKDVNIRGDIDVAYSKNAAHRNELNLGLNTAKSKFTGKINGLISTSAGEVGQADAYTTMILANGASWENALQNPNYKDEYGFVKISDNSMVENLQGGATLDKAGIIYQKDDNGIDVGKYSGAVKLVYDHDAAAPTTIKGGAFKVKSAAKDAKLQVFTDHTGVNDTNSTAVLNALANKVYYLGAIKGENNLQGSVNIAEGLTVSGLSANFDHLVKFDEKTGQGSYTAATKPEEKEPTPSTQPNPDKTEDKTESTTPVDLEFTTPILGKEDKEYETKGVKYGKDYVFKDTATITTKGKGNQSAVNITDESIVDIKAKDLSLNANGEAGTAGITVEKAKVKIAADKLNINTTVTTPLASSVDGINVNYKGDLKITGDTKIKLTGTKENVGISVHGKGQVITEGLVFNGDAKAKQNVYAAKVEEGTASLNYVNKQAGSHTVQLAGDIFTNNHEDDIETKHSVVNLGLGTEDSQWIGAATYSHEDTGYFDDIDGDIVSVDHPGEFNLALQNGAKWVNQIFGKNTYTTNQKFAGSMINNFYGGADKNKSGIILQKDKNDLTIDNYSGHTVVVYDHEAGEPTKFAAGNTVINKAAAGSGITLRTDHSGVTKDNQNDVLNKLANKLYYKAFVSGENNLDGTVEIAEGLTASSVSAKVTGNIAFAKKDGQGFLAVDSTKEETGSTVAPGEPSTPVTPVEPPTTEVTPDPGTGDETQGSTEDKKDTVGDNTPSHSMGGSGGIVDAFVKDNDGSITKSTVLTADQKVDLDYNKEDDRIGNYRLTSPVIGGIHPTVANINTFNKNNPMTVDVNGHQLDINVKGRRILYGVIVGANQYTALKDSKGTGVINIEAENSKDSKAANGIYLDGNSHLTADVAININSLKTEGLGVSGIIMQGNNNSEATFNKAVSIKNLVATGKKATSSKYADKNIAGINISGVNLVGDNTKATFNDTLTIENIAGYGVKTVGGDSMAVIKGANISVEESKAKANDYNAIYNNKGNVFINTEPVYLPKSSSEVQKFSATPGDKDVIITGDIVNNKVAAKEIVEYTQGKTFREVSFDSQVFMALTTKNSKFTGAFKAEDYIFYNADTKDKVAAGKVHDDSAGHSISKPGANHLWLTNGATWENKLIGADLSDAEYQKNKEINSKTANPNAPEKEYNPYQGSSLKDLYGGATAVEQGFIIQRDERPIQIENYSGHMTVGFDHNASNPTEIYGGQVKVAKAQENSVITLRTDNQGIDTSKGVDSAPVFNVLKSLAGKLVYEGATKGENNLVAKGEIAEGLTASAVSADFVKNYTFDKNTGVAQLEGEPTLEEPITPPSTGEVTPPATGEQPGTTTEPEQPSTGGTGEPEQPSTGDQSGTTTKPEKPSAGETAKPEKPGTTVTPGSEESKPAKPGTDTTKPGTGDTTKPVQPGSGESTVQPGTGEPTVQPGAGDTTVQPGSGEENPGIVIDPDKIVTKAYETKAMQSMRAAHENLFIGMRTLLNDVNKRLGDVRFNTKDAGFWVKLEHAKASYNGQNINANLKGNGIHMGYDRLTDHNWLVGGEISHLSTKGDHALGSSKGSINSLGIYGTKVNKDGSYVDIISKYGAIKNDLNHFVNNQKLTGQVKVKTTTFSVETGKRITDAKGGFIQPQVELSYGHMPKTHFIMQAKKATMDTSYTALNSLVARLGVAAGKTTDKGSWQGSFSVHRELMGTNAGIFTGENTKKVNYDYKDTWFTIGLSGTAKMGDNSTVYGKLSKDFGGKYGKGYNFSVGARWMF